MFAFAILLSGCASLAQAGTGASCKVFDSLSKRYGELPPAARPYEAKLNARLGVWIMSGHFDEASADAALKQHSLYSTQAGRDLRAAYQTYLAEKANLEEAEKAAAAAALASTAMRSSRATYALYSTELAILAKRAAELAQRVTQLRSAVRFATEKIAWLLAPIETLTVFGVEVAGVLKAGTMIIRRTAIIMTVAEAVTIPGNGKTEDRLLVDPLGERSYQGKNRYEQSPLDLLALSRNDACALLASNSAIEGRFLEIASWIFSRGTRAVLDPRAMVEAEGAKQVPAPTLPVATQPPKSKPVQLGFAVPAN